jgi:hypothetical protein
MPLRKMFLAPIHLAMPNLMLPAFNDSAESPARNSLFELAFARYGDGLLLKALGGTSRRNDHALWFGVDRFPAEVRVTDGSRNYVNSGYAVLTSGGTWLCVKYGPHGGGHGHPDKNNFILFGKGRVLFPDPGTRPYGSPLHAEWDRATIAHNTLVVDGVNQAQATGKSLAFGPNYSMTDAGAIYPGVRFIRTAAILSENVIVFVDRVTADREHTFDLANHYAGAWQGLRAGEPVSVAYPHVQDSAKRPELSLRTDTLAITLADNDRTEVITATGPGTSTAQRIPMSIFRRRGRETTYVWAVSLDGSPVKLEVESGPVTKVRAAGRTLVVDTANAAVRITD